MAYSNPVKNVYFGYVTVIQNSKKCFKAQQLDKSKNWTKRNNHSRSKNTAWHIACCRAPTSIQFNKRQFKVGFFKISVNKQSNWDI